jgi:methylated-DNA-[protein]-cysteine S-methyltransferase
MMMTPTSSAHAGLAQATMSTPVGPLTLVASDVGLRAVLWEKDRLGRVTIAGNVCVRQHPLLDQAVRELDEYFDGVRRTFEVTLDPVGTDFQLAAWEQLRLIPYGETISYGEQARRVGDARKARAVGAANGRNPLSIIVPCHRVVGADGSLTGFAAGIGTKAWLLRHEKRQAELPFEQ